MNQGHLPYPTETGSAFRLPVFDLFVIFGFLLFFANTVEKFFRPIGLDNIVYFGLYLGAAVYLFLLGYVVQLLRAAPLLFVLVSLPLASVLWSIDPRVSLLRGIEVLGPSLFAMLIGWHFRTADLLNRLAISAILMVGISTFLVLFVPSLGVMQGGAWGGAWIGLSEHKNGFGGALSIAFLILTYALFTSRYRLIVLTSMVVCLALLVGSRSATAMLVTAIGVLVGGFLLLLQLRARFGALLLILGAVAVPLGLWLFIAQDLGSQIVTALGKDQTLGGRFGVWSLVWPYIQDRWWLGYGYGAFWQTDLPWVDLIESRLRFVPYYSHNGVVELLLGGGAVMLAATGCVYVVSLLKSLVPVFKQSWHLEHGFAAVFMLTFVLRNLTEAAALTRNDIIWLLFVALAAGLARDVTYNVFGHSRAT